MQDVEIHVTKVFVVSAALPRLPLQVSFFMLIYFCICAQLYSAIFNVVTPQELLV